MKNISTAFILFILLVSFKPNSGNIQKVYIDGYVKNSNKEHVCLNYVSRIRGNLNFDNFRSLVTHINSRGQFNFNSDHITDGANYILEFNKHSIPLILFQGDSIQLEFDMKNPSNSLFVEGRGAGKINTLRLEQFGYNNFDFDNNKTLTVFTKHIEEVITGQINLLNSIYYKDIKSDWVLKADNKVEIEKIILESPLTRKEYNFLVNRINYQQYTLVTHFLSMISAQEKSETLEIDLNSKAFDVFNSNAYRSLDNINDWNFGNSLESILKVEYLRNLKQREGVKITYENWQSFFSGPRYENYMEWAANFLKKNFNNDIYSKYFSTLSGYSMTLGYDHNVYYKKLDTMNSGNKYVSRLKFFNSLLKNGLYNAEYDLSDNLLDHEQFNGLLENYKNKPLFIVFWSAQFAGSSLVNNLPVIKEFEKTNKDRVNVLYICIDNLAHKNLWAARIIDNDWKAEHYFLSIEGNESTLKNFSDKNISAFCYGGATYSFIAKNGTITNDIPFPFYQSVEEINNLTK
ncbi:hypothetical protein LRR18_08560 [Mangrovimonas sp. AS39]|uniref:hypothetical protein n=1 Tax=Mangrovimonas futianensis TaxID=2895523 RepID=UPI001E4566D9|nr:hypothetical protein [Mangrovimonas futianensis]MCF1191633.1 hypothetical protein [Mangrovimonas futianensis]MCF1195479.1 hypothetical protein [Mangrovimonas futianensis]